MTCVDVTVEDKITQFQVFSEGLSDGVGHDWHLLLFKGR